MLQQLNCVSETGVRMITCEKERNKGEDESKRLKERWIKREKVLCEMWSGYIQVSGCDGRCHNFDHSANLSLTS